MDELDVLLTRELIDDELTNPAQVVSRYSRLDLRIWYDKVRGRAAVSHQNPSLNGFPTARALVDS
jgi:hypothetical protein